MWWFSELPSCCLPSLILSATVQSIKNETNVSICGKKKERKKSQDFRVICVKSKSSLKLLMPSQSQVEFFISVSQVSLKSSNLRLQSNSSQVMWLESPTSDTFPCKYRQTPRISGYTFSLTCSQIWPILFIFFFFKSLCRLINHLPAARKREITHISFGFLYFPQITTKVTV